MTNPDELIENYFPTGEVESRHEVTDPSRGRSLRRRWYRNGQLFSETEFLHRKPHGRIREWTETGTLILDAVNKNGILDGYYQSWWDDGTLKEQGTFINGKRQTGYRWFATDGSLWKELQ
jgi:antitoxin component YwqK of YwqJK toxin-antitoxin module